MRAGLQKGPGKFWACELASKTPNKWLFLSSLLFFFFFFPAGKCSGEKMVLPLCISIQENQIKY